MWEVLGIAITSLHIAYSDLPTTAYSYDGEERNISQFYDQSTPNVYLGGHKILSDNTWATWNLDTGVHTDKLDTGKIGLNLKHNIKLSEGMDLTFNAGFDHSFNRNTPCTDNYNRKYYCADLTAWGGSERNQDVTDYNIGIRLSYNF